MTYVTYSTKLHITAGGRLHRSERDSHLNVYCLHCNLLKKKKKEENDGAP